MKIRAHLPLLAVLLGAATAWAVEPHLEIGPFSIEQGGHLLKLMDGRYEKWRTVTRSPYASLIPSKRAVLYTTSEPRARRVALRDYSGKVLWTNLESSPEFDDYHDHVIGGNFLLGTAGDPGFSGGKNDVLGWDSYLKTVPVTLLSLNGGHIMWESNQHEIGFPIWSNGEVFFAVRWDCARFQSHLPIWIEERRIRDRKCLWRAPLSGLPPRNLRVSSPLKGRARFLFGGAKAQPQLSFLKSLTALDITVPVLRGSVPRSSLAARYFERPED